MSSVVVFSDLQTAGGPCSNPCSSRFFPTFYGTFATHVSNAGMFLFLGRIELDPGYTCKPCCPAAMHSYTWLSATQTGPVSQQRGSRSSFLMNRADHRDEELIGAPFFMTIWNVVMWRAFYFRHSFEGAEGFGDELWWNSCFHMTRFYFRHGWALFEGCRRGSMMNLEFSS